MKKYLKVLQTLGQTPFSVALLNAKLAPNPELEIANTDYGFPPALIPLLSSSFPVQYGIWIKNPYNKEISYVSHETWADGTVYERARTETQFFHYLAVETLFMTEESRHGRVHEFLDVLGLNCVDEIFSLSGTMREALSSLSSFKDKRPLSVCIDKPDTYTGKFPVRGVFDSRWLNASACEFPDDLLDLWPLHLELPLWLNPETDNRTLCLSYIHDGYFEEAWYTLNRPGWMALEAVECIEALAENDRNHLVVSLCEFWLSSVNSNWTGY